MVSLFVQNMKYYDTTAFSGFMHRGRMGDGGYNRRMFARFSVTEQKKGIIERCKDGDMESHNHIPERWHNTTQINC